jgi:pSer/pThr/pTyr-binding forkhead associated (FHA) protein
MRLVIADEVILGRADDESGFRPDLDLEPFGAQDAGVSRRHARIAHHHGALFLSDLGSVNGTRINGFALEPDQACRLRDGDCVELGHLILCIHLHAT